MTNSTALALVISPLEQAIIDLKPLPRAVMMAKAKAAAKSVNCAPKVKAPKLPSVEQCDEFRFSAFNASINRQRLVRDLVKLLGATPSIEAFDLATTALREGYVAGALAKKLNGDLVVADTRKLFARASTLINQFASAAAATIPEGKLGRRNETEEKAVKSAAASISQLLRAGEITNPHKEANGGGARKPRPPVADDTVTVEPVAEVVLGKGKSFAELLAYYSTQAKAMSRTFNNNAKAKPDRVGDMIKLSNLVGDFAAGIALLNK